MGRRRALVLNGVLVVLLVAAGWLGYRLLWPGEAAQAAAGVRTTAAIRTTVTETVSAAATVQSGYTGSASFRTSGTVASIDVKVGSVVAKGQRLATLDSAEAAEQLQVAQANLDVAEETLDDPGKGNQESATSLQAKVDQARLARDQAQQTLDDTTLTAPGAGTVTAISGAVGEQAGSGSTNSANSTATSSSTSNTSAAGFITITDLSHLTVHADVAEIDVSEVKAGQAATVTVNALPDQPITGTVSQVDLTPTTTDNVVSYGVTLKLAKPPTGLRPGQSASVAVTVAKAEDAIAVPSAAVRTTTGSGTSVNTVTVLAGGQQETRTVEVGVRSESLVAVTSGLNEGDQVVLTTAATGTSNTNRPAGGEFPGGAGGLGGGGFGGGRGGGR